MAKSRKRCLGNIDRCARKLAERLGDDVSLRQIVILFAVANEDGEVRQVELQHSLGLNSAAMTRNLQGLGRGSARIKGSGLVNAIPDWSDQRHKVVTLTDDGRELIDDVLSVINGG